MAMQGYPGPYEKGKEIFGLREAAQNPGIFVFHAGTARKEGKIVTQGGRVLGVTAVGNTLGDAIRLAYEAAEKISWEGVYFRKDIGQKALRREVKK
jgi:phosphoribosylamine--glycine ligase